MDELDPDTDEIEREPGDIKVTLKKPDTENWGYDIVIFGCSATDPSVLETLRPDELVEFIETLHNFPTGPIQSHLRHRLWPCRQPGHGSAEWTLPERTEYVWSGR
jgi:hypothetical protein